MKYGSPRRHHQQLPQATFAAGTTRAPGSSASPNWSTNLAPSPSSASTPTFSCPQISG